ncbi:hypothetical protein FRC01_013584, partial [Tulasnella sp. 417]
MDTRKVDHFGVASGPASRAPNRRNSRTGYLHRPSGPFGGCKCMGSILPGHDRRMAKRKHHHCAHPVSCRFLSRLTGCQQRFSLCPTLLPPFQPGLNRPLCILRTHLPKQTRQQTLQHHSTLHLPRLLLLRGQHSPMHTLDQHVLRHRRLLRQHHHLPLASVSRRNQLRSTYVGSWWKHSVDFDICRAVGVY